MKKSLPFVILDLIQDPPEIQPFRISAGYRIWSGMTMGVLHIF